jgi:chromate transporter
MRGAHPAAPGARLLLGIWARVGLQSFGGGQAVQLLAYDELVDRRGWLTPADWAEAWGVCQVVPGVNVVAVAALTGSRLAGLRGVACSVGGLMIPSVVLTVMMTAVFNSVHDIHWVKAALHGIVFAAAGGSVMIGYRLIRPTLAASRADSVWLLVTGATIVVAAALLAISGAVPLAAVLIAAGALSSIVTAALRGSTDRGTT